MALARSGAGRCLIAWIVAFTIAAAAAGQERAPRFAGRLLADVLRDLQDIGVPLVFTSAMVTSEMRVRTEPRAATPRRQLDEILAPHALSAIEGPGGAIQVVRAARPRSHPLPSRRARVVEDAAVGIMLPPVYLERVVVTSPVTPVWPPTTVMTTLAAAETMTTLLPAGGVDDPGQRVHVFPRVAAVDDFRTELVVRASPFRHAEVVVDGVATPWLRHTAHARGEAGSVSMLSTEVLGDLTLRAGAYPRRYGERLGPQVDINLREGSRERHRVTGTLAASYASAVAEGPLISSTRGSWLVAARRSFLEWPSDHVEARRPVFAFGDATAKLVFDATSRQQFAVTLLHGRARVDGDDESGLDIPGEAFSDASALNASWRSLVGGATIVTQRAYVVGQSYQNADRGGRLESHGTDREAMYRIGISHRARRGVLEAGTQIGRVTWRRDIRTAADWTRAAYVHATANPAPRLTISTGVRVSDGSYDRAALSPWVQGNWAIGGRWTLSTAAGLSHQAPDLAQQHGLAAGSRLRPERATYVDVTATRQVSATIRAEATMFIRRERDVLRAADTPAEAPYRNALTGSSQGIELLVERRAAAGISGWLAYSHGHASHRDMVSDEHFSADFDQRHALTAFGAYRMREGTGIGATVRLGSGIPIPAYLARGERGVLTHASRRNEVRLPAYARVDVRADRPFHYLGQQMTLFTEVTNLLNRTNVAAAGGTIAAEGVATGFTETLLPRRLTAGLQLAF